MLDRVLEFTGALRDAGIPVAISESLDALRSLDHIELGERHRVRAAFAASIVKSDAHREAFDLLFDLYFGTGRGPEALDIDDRVDGSSSTEELLDDLSAALTSGDTGMLGGIARRAVASLGRLQGGSRDWYSNYEVMRALDLNSLVARTEAAIPDHLTALERRLMVDEIRRRAEEFRSLVLAETRRRVAEHRGAKAVASYAVKPLPADINFLSATADMAELRRAIRPLARKLATRIAMKRRRSTRGHLDVRRTVRRSLSSGGVPIEPALRHRAPHRPELFVLCDVSSSVSRFARFALMLTHALSSQFSRVRSFAFVDTIDEVTRFFDDEDFVAAVERMNDEAVVVSDDGHSDYGVVLERFNDTYGRDVGPKTTLLILGDARTNYRMRRPEALKALSSSARHTYWLNPEPIYDWDTGDSAASEYAAHVDDMVEVRNLRQLEDFIATRL
ncbi:MAG TPA: VWA domain-containing protein [Actinomycetota bacterium]|nr:VWA domain-containing protein [Actinomycetota bacterium]